VSLRALVVIVQPLPGLAQQNSQASTNSLSPTEGEGQHDFDFESVVEKLISGVWRIRSATWEVNWIATDTRMKDKSDPAH
jgi:hypothetical protein